MIDTEPPGYNVAWFVHVHVVPNSHIPVHVLHSAHFQNGERDQNGFVAVLCDALYDMITSRTMRIIWEVYSVLLVCLAF